MKELLIICCIVLLTTCKDRQAHSVPPVSTSERYNAFVEGGFNAQWQRLINSDSLKALYSEKAYKIFPDGTLISGGEAIAGYYQKTGISIGEVYTDTVIVADKNQEYAYEIGGFLTREGTPFKHLIIWNLNGPVPIRELELVAGTRYYSQDDKAIDDSRDQWIALCNENNVETLINSMYTANALYYNHKPMVIGRNDLIKEYSYMNNEDYSLKLSPLYLAQVSNSLVYEIGQCSGSYKGKYVIVWQNQPTGNWQVLFDSNK